MVYLFFSRDTVGHLHTGTHTLIIHSEALLHRHERCRMETGKQVMERVKREVTVWSWYLYARSEPVGLLQVSLPQSAGVIYFLMVNSYVNKINMQICKAWSHAVEADDIKSKDKYLNDETSLYLPTPFISLLQSHYLSLSSLCSHRFPFELHREGP